MTNDPRSAILLVSCPDQQGLVAALSTFISDKRGNILDLEQYVDAEGGRFFMRVQWDLAEFAIDAADLPGAIGELAARFDMDWRLHYSDERPRMAVFVSKYSHCMLDIFARIQANEWQVDIPCVISNHDDLRPLVENIGIAFHHLPVDAGNKAAQEQAVLEILREHDIDLIVLARYMQILSGEFIDHYPNRIINIHHSFLPAFPGARPYHSAHARGVKIIGATSHYVTRELDAGPIIEQDVTHVTHNDAVDDLIHKGRDLEKLVLARAIWKHLQRKILVHGNRTVVFD